MANKAISLLLRVNNRGNSKITKMFMSKAILRKILIRLIVPISHTHLITFPNILALQITTKIILTTRLRVRSLKIGSRREVEICNSSSLKDQALYLISLKGKEDPTTISSCEMRRQIPQQHWVLQMILVYDRVVHNSRMRYNLRWVIQIIIATTTLGHIIA